MLDVGGQDATEAFEDVGHSDEAREILEGLLVGKLKRQVRISTHHPFSLLVGVARRPLSLFPTLGGHLSGSLRNPHLGPRTHLNSSHRISCAGLSSE